MNKHLISIIVLMLPATMATAAQWPDFPFLYTVGTATKEVPPDLATITFNVMAYDESPEKSLAIVKKRSVELVDLFTKLEIPTKDIQSYEIDKQAVQQEQKSVELKILGYKVKQSFSVKLHGLSRYASLLDTLLKYRNVSDIGADFDVEQRKELVAALTADACAQAKAQAENMANGIGAKLGSVYAISDYSLSTLEESFGMAEMDTRGLFKHSMEGETTFIPSTIKLVKTVNVIYKLDTK